MNGLQFDKGFMKLAIKRMGNAKTTTNKNPFFTLSSFILKGGGNFSFLLQVRVDIIAGINLAGLLLICIVIHGARMVIKMCVSNCKIDFCNGGLLRHKKCMMSNDQRLPLS
jgi:hypothetical protein